MKTALAQWLDGRGAEKATSILEPFWS